MRGLITQTFQRAARSLVLSCSSILGAVREFIEALVQFMESRAVALVVVIQPVEQASKHALDRIDWRSWMRFHVLIGRRHVDPDRRWRGPFGPCAGGAAVRAMICFSRHPNSNERHALTVQPRLSSRGGQLLPGLARYQSSCSLA